MGCFERGYTWLRIRGIRIRWLTLGLTITPSLLNSFLGTKVSIFGHPITHVPNLHRFYYLDKGMIMCVRMFLNKIIVTCSILLATMDVGI